MEKEVRGRSGQRKRDMEIALQNHALLRKEQKIIELNGAIQEKDALLYHDPARKRKQKVFGRV